MIASLPGLWIPQQRAIEQTTAALADGHRRICLTLPTGGGKSRIACELIRDWLHVGYKVSLYTNRKMLIEQLKETLRKFGLDHGTRSADALDHSEMPTDQALQVSSIQTECSRVLKKKTWQLHQADRILIDEAHLQGGATAKTLMDMHLLQGASYVGLTATPLDIGHMYDHLIVAGTNSELRECGALVVAHHKAIGEPDMKKVRKETWDLSEGDVRTVMNLQHIVGSIIENYRAFNPEQKPTIGFAPGVPDSIWLCEQFRAAGIEAAHIDGTTCCYKGERYDSDADVRKRIMDDWRDGEIKVVWNRFVMREGIDAPFIEHMILATIFGSIQSYLQSVGRGLRASPSTGKTRCIIQDHGGNWWRHGSANANQEWELGMTEAIKQGMRQERLRGKKEREPLCCPKCKSVILTSKCACGFTIETKSRPVIQEDGTLTDVGGDIFTPRPTKMMANTESKWKEHYFRGRNGNKTFRQVREQFRHDNGYYPPENIPLMPKNERDWFRKVKDVPRSDLK